MQAPCGHYQTAAKPGSRLKCAENMPQGLPRPRRLRERLGRDLFMQRVQWIGRVPRGGAR